jgi:16S rRNA (adenine1518-N6/adenine1519-N6)-dimethyltransferase
MAQFHRRPKLGQHFLRSEDYCHRIADAAPLNADDLLVEIGPGRGDMTRLLVQRVRYLAAIEIDPALIRQLRQEFQDDSRVEIIEGDILKADLPEICRRYKMEQCVVFGNLPYYITSPILHHLFGARARIRHMTVLVQQEVAKRIAAGAGSADYGYLSVLAQCFSRPRVVLDLPPSAFSPPPKVRSTLVNFQMTPKFPSWDEKTYAGFLAFVQRCFAQKRKSLLNNLWQAYTRPAAQRALESLGLGPHVRAEELSLDQLAETFKILEE